jgi:hypothetical protein
VEYDCINCAEPVLKAQPHKVLEVIVRQQGGRDSGTLEVLESWPLCASCQRSQPVTLSRYVALRLA